MLLSSRTIKTYSHKWYLLGKFMPIDYIDRIREKDTLNDYMDMQHRNNRNYGVL